MLESLPAIFEAAFQNSGLLGMEFSNSQVYRLELNGLRYLEFRKRRETSIEKPPINQDENGVATYNVTVFGEDDSPVVALKNLKLKSMAPIPESQQFTFKR